MNPSSHYRTRTEECVELAQTARTTEHRIMLLHIAETWIRLADEAKEGDLAQHAAG